MANAAATPDIRGRFPVMNTVRYGQEYPMTGLNRLADRRYDVQQMTGAPVSNVDKGRWDRGILYRGYTPEIRPNGRNLFQYDPTAPEAWHQPQK